MYILTVEAWFMWSAASVRKQQVLHLVLSPKSDRPTDTSRSTSPIIQWFLF